MNQRIYEELNSLKKHTGLGHKKRNNAFIRQVSFAAALPDSGTIAPPSTLADLVSLYRFVGNEDVPLAKLRAIRAKTLLEPLVKGSDLLLIHDVSILDYTSHESKTDRRRVGNRHGLGYEYVSCLAINPQTAHMIGMVHDTLVNAQGPDDQQEMDYQDQEIFADFSDEEKNKLTRNHRHQMAVHIQGTSSLLSSWHVIDVADREFDDFFVFYRNQQQHRDFVIRSTADRNVQIRPYDWIPSSALTTHRADGHPLRPGHICVNSNRLIDHLPLQPYQTLPLDAQNRVVAPNQAKRLAELSIGSFKIVLYRDVQRGQKYLRTPQPLALNVVVIRELHPPPQCKPLCWVLFTSLPVDSFEQMAYVGRLYELRWKTEDFYRLLKSGYHLLQSRLDNARKLAKYLVIITFAATLVLNLKQAIGIPPEGTLNDQNYKKIKTAMMEPFNPSIDLNLRLFAFIAKSGRWLARRRDPIGPTILMRGMERLMIILNAWDQYAPLMEEARKNPQIISKLFCV